MSDKTRERFRVKRKRSSRPSRPSLETGATLTGRTALLRCARTRRPPTPSSRGPLPATHSWRASDGENQGRQPRRRDRRRRDDTNYLGVDQGPADPALCGYRPPLFRPRRRASGCHRRSGHGRLRRSDQGDRRRRQVRDHHARRGPRRGVRPQEDVALAQRHHPQHPRRHRVPRAHHLPQRAAPGAQAGRIPS